MRLPQHHAYINDITPHQQTSAIEIDEQALAKQMLEELDYALVKVSCEALGAHFQRVRRSVTRELAQVVNALQLKAPAPADGPASTAGLRARLAALREALVQADAHEKEILARCHRVRDVWFVKCFGLHYVSSWWVDTFITSRSCWPSRSQKPHPRPPASHHRRRPSIHAMGSWSGWYVASIPVQMQMISLHLMTHPLPP